MPNRRDEESRLLFSSVIEGLYCIDFDGNCTFANLACVRMLGYQTDQELLGKNMHSLIHHSYPDGAAMSIEDCPIHKASTIGKTTIRDKSVIWRADGSCFPAEYLSFPYIENGKTLGSIITLTDLSEQVKDREALQLRSVLLEAQSETSSDGILAVNSKHGIIYFNRMFAEMWELPRDLLDTKDDSLLIQYIITKIKNPEEFIRSTQYLYEHPSETSTNELYLSNGQCFIRNTSPLIGADGKHFGRIWHFRDCTERKLAEQSMRTSEQQYRLLAENISDVIWTMNSDKRFTYISPSIERIRGFSVQEAAEQTLEEALLPESMDRVTKDLARSAEMVRRGQRFPDFRGEIEQPCKNGSTVWMDVTITWMFDEAGQFVGGLGISRDVTKQRIIQKQLEFLAQHDMLTGLANRLLFTDRLERAIALARRENRNLAMLFIDLDNFKPINDHYGHAVGDLMLTEVANRMVSCVRASDTVGRMGGDEFVVMMPGHIEVSGAVVVGTKILNEMRKPFFIEGRSLHISSTIGVALYPEHGPNALHLMSNADTAMYIAKRSGGDSIGVFQGEL